jgi:HlyD family secretion protein
MDRAIARRPAWRRYGGYAAGAILVAAVAVGLQARSGGHVYRVPVNRLTLGTVTEGAFEDFIALRGNAAPLLTAHLAADQGGRVKEVLVEDGATVAAGQPLIILGNPALELQVASHQASTASQINMLENTELQLEQTRFKYQHDLLDIDHEISKLKGELGRDKILLDGNALAPATYRQEEEEYAYEQALRTAIIASRDAEQRVRTTQLTQLRKTLASLAESSTIADASIAALTIRAPMDGRLTALDAEVGQSKPLGAVLGQVDSLDRFKLVAQVDEFYLGRVLPGQAALFTIDARDSRAKVVKIYPQVANGTFKMDLDFDGVPPAGLHTGQAIEMKLELGSTAHALLLPNGPFYQSTGGNWAFVLAPDGRSAVRRSVRLGRRNPDYVEVVEGLRPGERIIVSDYQAFQTMDRIAFETP